MAESIGKKAETKIRDWLDRPEDGYSFDRIYDQTSGFYGSSNICDFECFKSPYMYYIESKATEGDRFEFNQLTPTQYQGLLDKSHIENVFGIVIVLFVTYKRAFAIDIREIKRSTDLGKKSINIKKIDKWIIEYKELQTIENNRKQLLDYTGELVELVDINYKENKHEDN